MISGGSRRSTLSPAVTVSSPAWRSAQLQLGVRHHAFHAEQQAHAAYVRQHGGMPPHQALQLLAQQPPLASRHCRGSRRPAARRAPHCRPPSPADCRRRCCRGCRRSAPAATFSVARQAPSGKPPPMPLAVATMSGLTPAHSCANSLPVRPMPHCTSSKNSSRPNSSATLRSACRYSRWSARMPPSPCTGSTRMARGLLA